MTERLNGKVVLISGGARGIGAETAKAVVRRGAKVVLTDIDEAALDETVEQLGANNAIGVAADVCELDQMEAAVAQGIERFGGLDIVLANAGIASYGSVLGVDPASFRRLIDINITGVFHTVRAALPAVIERQGYILVVSSLAAFAPAPGMAAYNASKAGVEHFANALRLEVAHQGVAVGCAHMSWIETPLLADAKRDLSAFSKMISSLPSPLNRTTDVETCAKAFAAGMEGRKRKVYCPGWVGAIAKSRVLVNSPLVERGLLKQVPKSLPALDAEVAQLGRSVSDRYTSANDPD